MADKSLTEEVESELKLDVVDDPFSWGVVYKLTIIMLCCLFLVAGLKINGVSYAPLFGFSAFFGLLYLGRDKT